MLKYQLNTKRIRNDLVPIELSDYSVEPMFGDKFKDKLLLKCYSDDEITFDKNVRILAMYEQYMVNDDFISSTAYNFNTIYHPIGVNKENRSFSIMFDKYFDLTVSKMSISTDEDGNQWWYIWFDGSHLFDVSAGDTYKMYITFDGTNGYEEDNPTVLTISTDEYVSSTIIRFPYSTLEGISGLENVIFYEEEGVQISDVSRVRFYRDNFVFDTGMFGLYLDRPMATVKLPIIQKFATDLYQDDAIRENFTDVEAKKAINKIVEMEKDVYHPVIWASVNDENHGYVKDEVYKIRFNLHFREHRGDDWLAEADTYWNGINSENPDNLRFINGYFTTDKVGKEEYQSDLLTYLNFTDKDVRYQKNKLKKSFLRVMFFDSMNPTNQNMLAYYTIFMDSGSYFSKYARYIETEGYRIIGKSGTFTGIKVDREPTKTSKRKDIDSNTDMDDVESVRLSSQFVVEDKYMSDASSEGFYLYLWKDNFLGTVPQDIYMKVEFNHAGYGRTIPFMMPFWDNKKWPSKKGIKTFEEILADWKNESGTDGPYGIQQYLKYSYIHFKYKYDKLSKPKRHVYYLDDEFYGTDVKNGGVHFEDNAITINLYEAKIV